MSRQHPRLFAPTWDQPGYAGAPVTARGALAARGGLRRAAGVVALRADDMMMLQEV